MCARLSAGGCRDSSRRFSGVWTSSGALAATRARRIGTSCPAYRNPDRYLPHSAKWRQLQERYFESKTKLSLWLLIRPRGDDLCQGIVRHFLFDSIGAVSLLRVDLYAVGFEVPLVATASH